LNDVDTSQSSIYKSALHYVWNNRWSESATKGTRASKRMSNI